MGELIEHPLMFTIQPKIVHRRQELNYSCGAAAVAMLFDAKEELIRKEVNTRVSGTRTLEVLEFFNRINLKTEWIHFNQSYFDLIENLITISYKFPIYSSATYLWKNRGVGRPITRHHASLIADGMIYDPSEDRERCGEEYIKTFNKGMTFNSIVIIDQERPNFLKNSRERY